MLKSIWTLVVSKGAHWQFREITPCKCLCFNWTVSSTRLWLLSIHLFTFTAATILQRNGFCQARERHFIFILCTFVHNRLHETGGSRPGSKQTWRDFIYPFNIKTDQYPNHHHTLHHLVTSLNPITRRNLSYFHLQLTVPLCWGAMFWIRELKCL